MRVNERTIDAGSAAAGVALLAVGERKLGLEAGALFAQALVLGAQRLDPLAQRCLGRALSRGRLERIDGVTIPSERLGRFPTFPSRLLRREEQLARFTETIEGAFDEMERATTDPLANEGVASPHAGSGAHEGA